MAQPRPLLEILSRLLLHLVGRGPLLPMCMVWREPLLPLLLVGRRPLLPLFLVRRGSLLPLFMLGGEPLLPLFLGGRAPVLLLSGGPSFQLSVHGAGGKSMSPDGVKRGAPNWDQSSEAGPDGCETSCHTLSLWRASGFGWGNKCSTWFDRNQVKAKGQSAKASGEEEKIVRTRYRHRREARPPAGQGKK